jgi:hypothetical protein
VRGFYVEYDDKETAKRVASMLNNTPISSKNSVLLVVKFVPGFQWSQQSNTDERVQMYKKLLRAEAEKEMRAIKAYKRNK